MPIKPIVYVDQPLVMPRPTSDTRGLGAILTANARTLSQIGMTAGDNKAAMLQRLGALFSGYQDTNRARAREKETDAIRAAERAAAEQLEREQMAQAAAERAEARRIAKESEERAAARYLVENQEPGPLSPEIASVAQRFPETAARISARQTLPATVTPGAMGEVSPDQGVYPVLEPSKEDTARSRAEVFQRTQAADAKAARERDDRRQEDALRDQRAYQGESLAIARQNAATSRMNAETTQSRYSPTGVDNENLEPEWVDALDSAIMSFPSTKRAPVVNQVNRAAAAGDKDRVREIIMQAAVEGENVDSRTQIRTRMATIAALDDTKAIINDLKSRGVPTNWFTGTAEDLARKLGTTTDPDLVYLKTRLQDAVVQYRRAATGVAFSEREAADYARMFPNYSQTLPVNEATMSGLKRAMETNNRSFWTQKLGKRGAALVLGDSAQEPTEPEPKTPAIERWERDENGKLRKVGG